MLAADAGVAVSSASVSDTAAITSTPTSSHAVATSGQAASSTTTSLVFVDGGVEDIESVAHAIPSNAELVILDSHRNGIEQVTEILASHQNLDSVHLISHGSDGAVQLGNQQLSNTNLSLHQEQLAAWAATRGLGKREAWKRLEAMDG